MPATKKKTDYQPYIATNTLTLTLTLTLKLPGAGYQEEPHYQPYTLTNTLPTP